MSAAASTSAVHDARSLRAVRNLSPHSAVNMASFSISKQWRCATVVAGYRPVVFVPIDRVDRPFRLRDVFCYHRALSVALLDESMRAALDEAAHDYESGPTDAPGAREHRGTLNAEVRSVGGTVRFKEVPKGKRSHVRIVVSFREVGDEYRAFSQDFTPTDALAERPVRIEVNRPLSRYGGATASFVKGRFSMHGSAQVRSLRLEARLSSGERVKLLDVDDLTLPANEEVSLPALLRHRELDDSASPVVRAGEMHSRLLAHLNTCQAYYRLAIDLQLDSASRFRRLVARVREELRRQLGVGDGESLTDDQAEELLPIDLQPLGVVGGHLAFTTAKSVDQEKAARKGLGKRPKYFLVSTPTDGTFVEAIPGRYEVGKAAAQSAPVLPSGPQGQSVTYPWPDRVAPSPATIQSVLAPAQSAPQLGTAPGLSEPHVGSKVPDAQSDATTAHEGSAVQAAANAADASRAVTPSSDSTDSTSQTGTTETQKEGG
jgi:hypothetical protein